MVMQRPAVIEDAEIRQILRPFSDRAGREVMPAQMDPADILIKFLETDASFQSIRNDIANAKVSLARASRPGSATRSSMKDLQARLLSLRADRQRIVARAAESDEFLAACRSERKLYARQLEEWEATQAVARRVRAVLDRERLPSVMRPRSITILSVLEAVEMHVDAAPRPGSLIVMGSEPRPLDPMFLPRDATASGINRRMYTAAVRLAASPGSERGDRAELAGAVSSRNALVMPISEHRRPVDESHWEKFDDILPFAARRVCLPIVPTCMPHSSPFSSLHKLLATDSWRSIRDSATDRSNGTCVACGSAAGGEVRAEWEFIEPLRTSSAFGIQRLVDVRSYCAACISVIFPNPGDLVSLAPRMEGYERSQEVYVVNPKMSRLSRLNRWDEDASPDPLTTAVSIAQIAYQRRSRVRWALDLEILHGRNVSLNPDMVMHRKGWIMRREDVPAFDEHRSVHLTRIFGCSFANSTGELHFFQLPPVFRMPWDSSVADLAQTARSAEALDDEPAYVPAVEEDVDPAGPENPDEEDYDVEEGVPFSVSI